jgi:transmembrane sensor
VTSRRLAHYVQPRLPEERVAQQWSEAERRAQRRPVAGRLAGGMALGVALAAALVFVLRARPPHGAGSIEGTLLEGGDVVLPDGSQIAVDTGGQVRIAAVRPDRVELGLVTGTMSLAIPHGQRRVLVHAGAYDVIDLGTRFHVALGADGEVSVEVLEGTVEIESRAGSSPAFHLGAGGKWSSGPVSTTAPGPTASIAETLPASSPAAPDDSIASLPPGLSPGPRELLESAEHARLAGHLQVAAAAFDALRRRYRHDPRAALAALELGRLRLDSLRDAPGAVEALTDAISLAPRGPLREDAEARRVEALAAQHSPECATARDAFLARYPNGVHRAIVSGQCAAD